MRNYRNIYQTARELKGLTQEAAAERLDISVDSLGAYEQDRRRPPDSTVLRMAQLYDFPYLCYQHIASGELGGVLPEVTPTSLEQATMRLVRLIGKFAKSGRLDQLLEINEDGRITAEERPLHDAIMAELRDITSTYLELDCATQKESAQGGGNRN
ncbi:MAG TPA: helix-turn-helix domain-containing protein [Candidatus Agathobaculum pullistercoris]|nr:helix-turn-helix domain-containing protein [uncultured Agathobaculum sp.]HIX10237.1 helix-turn-helix domain-containing protein [Candidatus Agathobaculum pullistercoris]